MSEALIPSENKADTDKKSSKDDETKNGHDDVDEDDDLFATDDDDGDEPPAAKNLGNKEEKPPEAAAATVTTGNSPVERRLSIPRKQSGGTSGKLSSGTNNNNNNNRTAAAEKFGLPAGVNVPSSVTAKLLDGKLLETLKSLPLNHINDALTEYDDAVKVKGASIRNHGAYLYGVIKRYIAVQDRAHSGILPMGANLTPAVQGRIRDLVSRGFCTNDELNEKVKTKIRMLSEKDALEVFDELTSVERRRIRSFASYFMGILNQKLRGPDVPPGSHGHVKLDHISRSAPRNEPRGKYGEPRGRDDRNYRDSSRRDSYPRERSRDRYDDDRRKNDRYNRGGPERDLPRYDSRQQHQLVPRQLPPPPPSSTQPQGMSGGYNPIQQQQQQQQPMYGQGFQPPQQQQMYGQPLQQAFPPNTNQQFVSSMVNAPNNMPPMNNVGQPPQQNSMQPQQQNFMQSSQPPMQQYQQFGQQQLPQQQPMMNPMNNSQQHMPQGQLQPPPQQQQSMMGGFAPRQASQPPQQYPGPYSSHPQNNLQQQPPTSYNPTQAPVGGMQAPPPQQQHMQGQVQPSVDILGLANQVTQALHQNNRGTLLQQQGPALSFSSSGPNPNHPPMSSYPPPHNQQPNAAQMPPYQQQHQPPYMVPNQNAGPNSYPNNRNRGRKHTSSATLNDLPPSVQYAVRNLQTTEGIVLDDGMLGMVSELPEHLAVAALQKFSSIDKRSMRNPTAYLVGVLKKELQQVGKR